MRFAPPPLPTFGGLHVHPADCGAASYCLVKDLGMTDDRLIDGDEAGAICGIKSRSRRYALIAQGRFPQPIKVGASTRFSERECRAFVQERIAERDKGGKS
jgi:predicted DNA-binding transcriptional regulator AlpA